MNQISLDWDTVKAAYPMRPLTGALKAFMDHTPGTPCCVQMSHALGVGGCLIGARSNRRANSRITTPTGTRYYLLAVDEMKWFLEDNFGLGDKISTGEGGGRHSRKDMMAVLNGRTGILVFSEPPYGKHTELWDVDHMHQKDISSAVFDTPKVLFWDVMITAQA
jgi:hypothetical protein